MATGGEARQKGVEELEQEVTCPVCQDRFQEPKILPCLHYYCKGCIEALAKRAGGPNQSFPCPECRTPTLLPQGDPDQLQTAFFVNRMKEVHAKLEKVQGKVEAKCEMCSGGVAIAFCRHCMNFICAECVKSHQRLKVFAGHEISTLAELKEGGVRNIVAKPPPPPMCKIHEEQAKIYCYDCKTLICRDCVVKDHRDHEYEFVKKAAPETKKNLREHMAPLNKIQDDVNNAVKNIQGAKAEVAAMDESMTVSIKRSFKELRDVLDKREKELLAETAATVEKKMTNLTVQQKKLEMSSGTIQSLVEFVERSVENATDEELMTIHTQMMTRISEETEKQRLSNLELDPVEEVDREVTIDCASELKKLCQQNAKMVITPMNVAIENIDPTVGKTSKVGMCLTYQNGPPALKMQNINAILTSKVDGSRVATKIARKQQNTYQIEFTPTVRGRHQLEVMYNDKLVLREPAQVFVKIPPTMLGKTVRRINIGKPARFIAFNSSEEMVVTPAIGNEVITFDKSGKKLRYFINERLLIDPSGVAVDGSNIYITDFSKNILLKFDETGKVLKSVGQNGSGEGEFDGPGGLTIVGDEVIVCDGDNHRLQVFTSDLVFVRQIGSLGKGNGQLLYPRDVTHDEDGTLFVADNGNNRVQAFSINGEFVCIVVTPDHSTNPAGITYHNELLYISQWKENRALYVCCKNGEEGCSIQCDYSKGGVATDQDGYIYLCDIDKSEVVVI
jgi:DNA-binding beta-propeller fold protein YncE